MNSAHLYTLTEEEKKLYSVQPDNIPFFETKMHDEYELSQSVKGTSLRFWLNDLTTDFSIHWHTTVELITVLEGSYTVIANNIKYQLMEGDILLLPSGTLHSIEPSDKGYRFIFLFEMEPFMGFQNNQNIRALLTNPILVTEEKDPQFYETAITLIRAAAQEYWAKDKSYKELTIYSILMKLIAEYGNYRMKMLDHSSMPSYATPDLALRLNRVYQYIDDHLSENIQLEDAAKIANYSLYHFSRIFKESTGQTFSSYLRQVRIKASQQLLQQLDTQIIWIAHECGFSSLSTFNRTFRSVTGSTPSEYRALWVNKGQYMNDNVSGK